MKLIVGLGNPGEKYKLTRHNVGFLLLEAYSNKKNLNFSKYGSLYHFAEKRSNNRSFVLLKPDTYMNLSGDAVSHYAKNHGILPDDILVIYDDISLEFGLLRFRQKGGDGGHNGMTSIINKLNTHNFSRLRVGIGSDFGRGQMADYVLDKFSADEMSKLSELQETVVGIVDSFIFNGSKGALDYFSKLNNK